MWFLLTSGVAAAQGRMVIKPYVKTSWGIESNYYKSETNERSVSYWSISPGVNFGYTTAKSELMFGYSFSPIRYTDEDDAPAGGIRSKDLDFVQHAGSLSARTKATDRITLTLDDSFSRQRDPDDSDIFNNSTDKSLYWTNTVTPGFIYDFGNKFTFGTKYSYLILDYKDDINNEDSYQHRGAFTLGYNFNSTTSANLDYQVWTRDYDKTTSDYTSHQIGVNVNKRYRVLGFEAGAGYHNREFDQSGLDDMDSFLWHLSMTASYPKTSFYVNLRRNLNDQGAGEQYYQALRLTAGANRVVLEKLNVGISGFVQNSDYENSSRDEDLWGIDGSIGYRLNRYVTLGLETGYEERDSNQAGNTYDNYKVLLSASLNYDVGDLTR